MLLIITMCILQEARNVDVYSKKLQDRWQKKPIKIFVWSEITFYFFSPSSGVVFPAETNYK